MHKAKKNNQVKAFTLVEILVVIAIIAILSVVAFVAINPGQRINDANDSRRQDEVQSILGAISLYAVDNAGALPTAGGAALPVVTNANIMTTGAAAETLDGLDVLLPTIPVDPAGASYRVGRLANGAVIVGITLSNGSLFAKTQ